MTNLPTDGSLVYVTLYGYNGSTWAVQDTGTYTAAGGAPQQSKPEEEGERARTATQTLTTSNRCN